mgnify:CR=1 FL=1
MNSITHFLEHFKKIISKEGMVKIHIQDSIEKFAKIKVNSKEIKISGSRIYIQAHPIKKNETMFHSENIISEINKKTNKNFVSIN